MTMTDQPRACRACGCTDGDACFTAFGPCHWPSSDDDLCSACAAAERPIDRKARADAWRWSGVGFAKAPD